MNNLQLRYNAEAANWDEALPLGNGRMGAMVFGGAASERLALNDETLWSGFPQSHDKINAVNDYIHARTLAMAGRYKEAQEHIEKFCLGKNSQRYLPLGDLLLEMPVTHAQGTNYSRMLDIENAAFSMQYDANGATFKREIFVSAPDNMLVIRLTANAKNTVNLTARLTCKLKHDASVMVSPTGNRLVMQGQAEPTDNPDPAQQGMAFCVVADFEATNGEITANGEALQIKNADEVIIRMVWRTNFKDAFTPPMQSGINPQELCEKDLSLKMSYASLKSRHIADYQSFFNRVDIHFNENISTASLPLPQRLANWERAENDPNVFALLFQYGRYLMISGSRPDSAAPLNLQGIWNAHFYAPWSSNYTLNINAEMNYWSANVANLADCQQPLFNFIEVLRKTGAKTAKAHYGAKGFTAHHNSDIWGMSTPVAQDDKFGAARWAFWSLAGGWLSAHAFNHYMYTRDESFLKNVAFPIVRDAAEFFLDVLIEDEEGNLIFAPSTSPENDFLYDGTPISVSKTTTMTTAIIKETLKNYKILVELLRKLARGSGGSAHREFDLSFDLDAIINKLPPYKIGTRGELLEWNAEFEEAEPTHRHTSHLYPLYPGYEIKAGTPLADACRKTLDLRGDESTGWALAWRINLFARLQDAERAFSFLKMQLRPCEGWRGGCYPNLFGAHPPFQIDSNFGATAGIAEMLVQSTPENEIHLLPALPKALGNGYVKGLRAMGGVTVSMEFSRQQLTQAKLTLDAHISAQKYTIIYKNTRTEIMLTPSKTEVFTP
ncbi:MAG: glycoside hydrolase family 95 protein [Defluviitaleaceae bacterium]|nr:glycoside hydrolase family 95 protein [Defluviitaleaceae bacterium]MCL2273699.1 glycoside hydrolase family 95 protein [Defluviitaleaceae bacterium]